MICFSHFIDLFWSRPEKTSTASLLNVAVYLKRAKVRPSTGVGLDGEHLSSSSPDAVIGAAKDDHCPRHHKLIFVLVNISEKKVRLL